MGNVVITGGSRGIGAAAVELFAARGDRVTFLYEKNHAAAKAVAEKTGATAICCDVADGEAVNRAFARMGDVDILVCNAGTMYFGLLSQMAEADCRLRQCVHYKRGFLGQPCHNIQNDEGQYFCRVIRSRQNAAYRERRCGGKIAGSAP